MLGPHVDRAYIPRLGICIYTIGRVDPTIYLQQLFLEHLSLDKTPPPWAYHELPTLQ
jgi:hypothetical protein